MQGFFGYPLLSQERVKLRTSNFVGTFTGSIGTKAHDNVGNSGVVRESRKLSARAPICRAHCAVIFAIAQLSCTQQCANYAEWDIGKGYYFITVSYTILQGSSSYDSHGSRRKLVQTIMSTVNGMAISFRWILCSIIFAIISDIFFQK